MKSQFIVKPNPRGGFSPYLKYWFLHFPLIVKTQKWRRSKMVGTAWFDDGETDEIHPRFKSPERCKEVITQYLKTHKKNPNTILHALELWPGNTDNIRKSDCIMYREIYWDNPIIWQVVE